jgi:hypothetical protein
MDVHETGHACLIIHLIYFKAVFWPRVKRKTENRSVNSQKCPGRNSGCFYLSLFRLAAVTPEGAFFVGMFFLY